MMWMSRAPRMLVSAGLVLLGVLLLAPASAWAGVSNPTWTGVGAAAGNPDWSVGANWGGTAPAEPVGTVTFGPLSGCSPGGSCYQSRNDGVLTSANALAIDDTDGYVLSGTPLQLGGLGIRGTAYNPDVVGPFDLTDLPLTLTALQTWLIDGGSGSQPGGLVVGAIGGSYPLTLQLPNGGYVSFDGDAEVGDVTVSDGGSIDLADGGALNATSGGQVELMGGTTLNVLGPGASIGTLVADIGSTIDVAYGSPMTATGNVSLGGTLTLNAGSTCPTLAPGDSATLITASGTISGAFSNATTGELVTMSGCGGQQVEITYTAHTVTATIPGGTAPSTTPPPPSTGPPVAPTTPPPVKVSSPTMKLGKAKVTRTTAAAPVSCRGAAGTTCIVTLTLTETEKLRSGKVVALSARKVKTTKKVVTLSRARVTVRAGSTRTVKLSLNAMGRRLLVAHHRLAAKLTASQSSRGRTSTVKSETVTFKASRKSPA